MRITIDDNGEVKFKAFGLETTRIVKANETLQKVIKLTHGHQDLEDIHAKALRAWGTVDSFLREIGVEIGVRPRV